MADEDFDRKAAVQAANENRDLRERLESLKEEDRQAQSKKPLHSSPGRSDKIRKQNEELKDTIINLKRDLGDLRRTNVTQLYHTYTRLNTRLAYLNNENMSLRSVLANQRQGVRKATRTFHDHQVRRRKNEQNNTHTKQDIQMIKERREESVAESNELRKEKERLESELEELPLVGKDPAAVQKKLQEEYKANERELDRMEREARENEKNAGDETGHNPEDDQDLEDLREEYKELKQELKLAKKNQVIPR